jgi:hypothetical protein
MHGHEARFSHGHGRSHYAHAVSSESTPCVYEDVHAWYMVPLLSRGRGDCESMAAGWPTRMRVTP